MVGCQVRHHCHRCLPPLEQERQEDLRGPVLFFVSNQDYSFGLEACLPGRGALQRKHFWRVA